MLDQAAGTVRFAKEGVRINLGGIAKGYVVERGIDILRHRGITNAIVTAGGDSRLLGDRRGRPWMVGIRDPRNDGRGGYFGTPRRRGNLDVRGLRALFRRGRRALSPYYSAQHRRARPAVCTAPRYLGPDAVITDALSTSVFVMGVEQGLTLIGTLPDYESIVIDADGKVFYSDGLSAA